MVSNYNMLKGKIGIFHRLFPRKKVMKRSLYVYISYCFYRIFIIFI